MPPERFDALVEPAHPLAKVREHDRRIGYLRLLRHGAESLADHAARRERRAMSGAVG